MRITVPLLLAALLLSACGYRGPLYLPKPEAERPAPATDPAKDSTQTK
jgi:predicted small lipoprotein YifL